MVQALSTSPDDPNLHIHREINMDWALRFVPIEALAEIFPDYEWNPTARTGIHIRRDWRVSAYLGLYGGDNCIVFQRTDKAFIFFASTTLGESHE